MRVCTREGVSFQLNPIILNVEAGCENIRPSFIDLGHKVIDQIIKGVRFLFTLL